LPVAFHTALSQLFTTFSLVGGMPEALTRFAENSDIVETVI